MEPMTHRLPAYYPITPGAPTIPNNTPKHTHFEAIFNLYVYFQPWRLISTLGRVRTLKSIITFYVCVAFSGCTVRQGDIWHLISLLRLSQPNRATNCSFTVKLDLCLFNGLTPKWSHFVLFKVKKRFEGIRPRFSVFFILLFFLFIILNVNYM